MRLHGVAVGRRSFSPERKAEKHSQGLLDARREGPLGTLSNTAASHSDAEPEAGPRKGWVLTGRGNKGTLWLRGEHSGS